MSCYSFPFCYDSKTTAYSSLRFAAVCIYVYLALSETFIISSIIAVLVYFVILVSYKLSAVVSLCSSNSNFFLEMFEIFNVAFNFSCLIFPSPLTFD